MLDRLLRRARPSKIKIVAHGPVDENLDWVVAQIEKIKKLHPEIKIEAELTNY